MAYGASWSWSRPGLALSGDIGQSYRMTDPGALFPVGTGLSDNLSDIVGRFSLRTGRLGTVTQRFRLDKDDLTVRRSELDVTIGTDRTFATVGYLRFNRDIDLEDLVDQEEVRFGAQLAIFRYWAVFASAIIDLTSEDEDPLTSNDGFQPVRSRVGFIYADECFDFRFTWRRSYVENINAPLGNSFSFSFRLKNLGTGPTARSAMVQGDESMARTGVLR
jgi:LPS-assembly protein